MSLSELRYGAFLSYSRDAAGPLADVARDWRSNLKNERVVQGRTTSEWIANRMQAGWSGLGLEPIFEPCPILVPVPSSRKRRKGSLWVPLRLAEALVREGLAQGIALCLSRVSTIRKAAWSTAADRPTLDDHAASLAVEADVLPTSEIVLIDDVVTQGTTLLACARALQAAWPEARIRAFAAMRAVQAEEFTELRSPCLGTIRPRGQWAVRRP